MPETLTAPSPTTAPVLASDFADPDDPSTHASASGKSSAPAVVSTFDDPDDPNAHAQTSQAPEVTSTFADPDDPNGHLTSSAPQTEQQTAPQTEPSLGINMDWSSSPIHYIDQNADKSIADSASAALTHQRVDTTVGAPEAPATADQIQRIADSNKDVHVLAAQDQISRDTAIQALNLRDQNASHMTPDQRTATTLGDAWGMASGIWNNFWGAVGGELKPLIQGSRGPILGGAEDVALDLGNLAGNQMVNHTPYDLLSGQDTGFGGPTRTPNSDANQQPEIQRETRNVLSGAENVGTFARDIAQITAQKGIDTTQTYNPLSGEDTGFPADPSYSQGGAVLGNSHFLLHSPWSTLTDAQKVQATDALIQQKRDDAKEMSGQSDLVTGVMKMAAEPGTHLLTPEEQKAAGKEPSPDEISAPSLILQAGLTHGLGEIPGADAVIERAANAAINTMRIPTYTSGLALKGLSAAAKNDAAMGTIGTLGGIVKSGFDLTHGIVNPMTLVGDLGGDMYWGQKAFTKGGKLASKVLDFAAVPVNYLDRVLATATSEAMEGRPFFSGSLSGWNPDEWVPSWLKPYPQSLDASMGLAGPVTRGLAAPISGAVKGMIGGAALSPFMTDNQEDAEKMIGQMGAFGLAEH
jgi:hypothetical protein